MRVEAFRADHVEKHVEGEHILSDINLCCFAGAIHAVLMQSASGRHALADIFTGKTAQDSGALYLFDMPYRVQSSYQAKNQGVFCIGHKSHLVPGLSIAENLFLTDDRYVKRGFVDARAQHLDAAELLKQGRLGHIQPKQLAGTLSACEAHMVESLSAVSQHAKVLLFENVMERYTDTEMQQVLRFLSLLKEQGLCIILFSGKYNASFDVADHASIVHHGVTVANYSKGSITRETLLRHFSAQTYHRAKPETGPGNSEVLRLEGVSSVALPVPIFWGVRAGEVTGVWDQEFLRSPALVDALFGRASYRGEILLRGKRLSGHSFKSILEQGLILIPEKMGANYVFHNMGLEENVTLMMRSPLYQWGMRSERMQHFASCYALSVLQSERLQRRCADMDALPHLRRHEQMQVIVARWLCCKPKALVFVNPFFSYDDVTMYEFQEMMDLLRREGIAIVILSMNLRELKLVSDNIYSFQETLTRLA